MEGSRVAVVVDGERREGTVVSATYTVKGGDPVLGVELDEALSGGRARHAVSLADAELI
jgi:hypothetical protein